MTRRAPWLLLALTLLVAAHTGYWLWAQHLLREGLHRWVLQQGAMGYGIAMGPQAQGGWPLRAQMSLADVHYSLPDRGLDWWAARVLVRVDLAAPGTLHVLAEGPQRLRGRNGVDYPFESSEARLSLPLASVGPPAWLEVLFRNLRIQRPDGQASVGLAHLRTTHAARSSLSIGASAIALPPSVAVGLGEQIESLTLAATLSGPPLAMPASRADVQVWRDGGGRLELTQARLRWGNLQASATGTLGLDGQLQPSMALTIRALGVPWAIDALAASRAIPASTAVGTKAMLSLATRPTGPGGAPEVHLPLNLDGGNLRLGAVPLGRLRPITWPPP